LELSLSLPIDICENSAAVAIDIGDSAKIDHEFFVVEGRTEPLPSSIQFC